LCEHPPLYTRANFATATVLVWTDNVTPANSLVTKFCGQIAFHAKSTLKDTVARTGRSIMPMVG
jgi:hypothetical protein